MGDDLKIKFQPKSAPLEGRTPTPGRATTPNKCRTTTPNKAVKARTPTPRGTNAPPGARKAEVFAKVELRRVAVAMSEVQKRAVPATRVPWPAGEPDPTFPIYERALELAALAHAIVEHSDGERYYIRDQLDRKSTDVPQLVSRALAAGDMATRRELYAQARGLVGDISSIFDMLATRRTVAAEALEPARALARVLGAELAGLAVPPPRVY